MYKSIIPQLMMFQDRVYRNSFPLHACLSGQKRKEMASSHKLRPLSNHTQKQHELGKPSCPMFLISHVYRQRAKPPPAWDQLRPCSHTTPGKLKGQPSPLVLPRCFLLECPLVQLSVSDLGTLPLRGPSTAAGEAAAAGLPVYIQSPV